MERIQKRIGHVRIQVFPRAVSSRIPAVVDRCDFTWKSVVGACVKDLHQDSLTVAPQICTEVFGEYEHPVRQRVIPRAVREGRGP